MVHSSDILQVTAAAVQVYSSIQVLHVDKHDSPRSKLLAELFSGTLPLLVNLPSLQ
jgi:hypothetical protein